MKKGYIVYQESESDCGSCCLYSIIKYYSGFVPLEIIKRDTYTTKDGTSFLNLKKAGEKYGFEVKGYKKEKLIISNEPYIAHLKIKEGIYHFVVIYNVSDENILCMDPSTGMKRYQIDEFYKLFTGNILVFNPIDKIIKYKENDELKNNIIKILKRNLKSLLPILIFSLTIILISLYETHLIRIISIHSGLKFILLLILLITIKIILNYAKNIILVHLNKKSSYSLIKNYLNHVFNLPLKDLQLKSSGEIVSKIADFDILNSFISKEILNLTISGILIIALLLVLFSISVPITILIIGLTTIYLFIILLFNHHGYYLYLSKIENESVYLNLLIEFLNKIETIKNLSKEKYFLKKIDLNIINKNNSSYNLDKFLNKLNLINDLYSNICLIIILVLSYFLNYSLENIFVIILYFNYFIDNIHYYSEIIPSIIYLKSILLKLNGLYYLEEENNSIRRFKIEKIEAKNIFYNINNHPILNNISIIINNKEKVLLVGNNGSGKSTLLKIINGSINDFKGSIYINNKKINSSLKKQIYLSSQNDNLFIDTVVNNIILDKKFDEAKFNRIANILSLDRIIMNKTYGYETIIKDNFSGGEKQIIIIARALYQEYDVILFDESFSEINHILRAKLIKRINKAFKSKTIIYVSHNKESYNFDKIITLNARKDNNANG